MMACDVCELAQKKENVLYSGSNVLIILPRKGANKGHLWLVPKRHFTIIEQLPDDVLAEAFLTSRIALTLLFDGLSAQGTNFLVQNGIVAGQQQSHIIFHLIPRWENDGVDFLWSPKRLSEEEMSTVELKLKEEVAKAFAKEQKEVEEKAAIVQEARKLEDEWIKRQLVRIP